MKDLNEEHIACRRDSALWDKVGSSVDIQASGTGINLIAFFSRDTALERGVNPDDATTEDEIQSLDSEPQRDRRVTEGHRL